MGPCVSDVTFLHQRRSVGARVSDVAIFNHGFSWFLVGFHGFSRWFPGFSWFLVGFYGFSRWFHGFSWFWLVSMVFLVENTTKLYPGPTIQSKPCRP